MSWANSIFRVAHFWNMLFLSRRSSSDVILIASSSRADTVAAVHKTKAVMFNPHKLCKKGNTNNKSPVSLFRRVCKNARARYFTNPAAKESRRRTVIIPIQHNSQKGQGNTGIKRISNTPMKTTSATLSKAAPNGLLLLVFLAIYPSRISLTPPRRKRA